MSVAELELLERMPTDEGLDFGQVVDLLTSSRGITEEQAILLVHEAIAEGQLRLTSGFLVSRAG